MSKPERPPLFTPHYVDQCNDAVLAAWLRKVWTPRIGDWVWRMPDNEPRLVVETMRYLPSGYSEVHLYHPGDDKLWVSVNECNWLPTEDDWTWLLPQIDPSFRAEDWKSDIGADRALAALYRAIDWLSGTGLV